MLRELEEAARAREESVRGLKMQLADADVVVLQERQTHRDAVAAVTRVRVTELRQW